MFDSLFHPIQIAEHKDLKRYEGNGNYAIGKYYNFPFRPFYRKKLYIARNLLDKNRVYRNIMDFGSGPGIFTKELKKHALSVKNYEYGEPIDRRWRYDCIIALSVLEFVEDLEECIDTLHKISTVNTQLIVVSPMDTLLTKTYFKLISDKKVRNSQSNILRLIDSRFKITKHDEWCGLYFSVKGIAR